jgi:predicted ATPase
VVTTSADRPGRARFAHALFQEAFYQRIHRARRGVLHRRAGDALEALFVSSSGTDLPMLAHHFVAALSAGGSPAKAIEYSVATGRLSAEMLAPRGSRQALLERPAGAGVAG